MKGKFAPKLAHYKYYKTHTHTHTYITTQAGTLDRLVHNTMVIK